MATIDNAGRRVSLEFVARGRGVVALTVKVGEKAFIDTALILHYAEQGQLVDAPPIDEQNASLLNEAAEALNARLAELCA